MESLGSLVLGPPRGGDPSPDDIKAASARLIEQFNIEKENRMTRCKVRCTSVAKTLGWNTKTPFLYKADFVPVGDNSPENKEFFEATPQGAVSFSTVRADHFDVGKLYYVDFTEAQ